MKTTIKVCSDEKLYDFLVGVLKKTVEKKQGAIKATCSACQREFWATEAYVSAVQAGRLENLCGGCDESHNDGGV